MTIRASRQPPGFVRKYAWFVFAACFYNLIMFSAYTRVPGWVLLYLLADTTVHLYCAVGLLQGSKRAAKIHLAAYAVYFATWLQLGLMYDLDPDDIFRLSVRTAIRAVIAGVVLALAWHELPSPDGRATALTEEPPGAPPVTPLPRPDHPDAATGTACQTSEASTTTNQQD